MELFWLLSACISVSAAAQSLPQILGLLNSSMNLSTSFDPLDVKDMTWKREINGCRKRIARIKNDVFMENLNNRYKQFYNGTVLGMDNLTENDGGRYIADVTFLNNTSQDEEFNLTLVELTAKSPPLNTEMKSYEHILTVLLPILAALAVAGGLYWWKCCKRSSNTTGQEEVKRSNSILLISYSSSFKRVVPRVSRWLKLRKRSSNTTNQESPEPAVIYVSPDPSKEPLIDGTDLIILAIDEGCRKDMSHYC